VVLAMPAQGTELPSADGKWRLFNMFNMKVGQQFSQLVCLKREINRSISSRFLLALACEVKVKVVVFLSLPIAS